MVELEQLREHVCRFRFAIDAAKIGSDSRISWLHRFPKDCCDLSVQLLSCLLYQKGYRNFRVVSADLHFVSERREPVRHVWLKIGSIDIDITADQFEEMANDSVVVREASPFHANLHELKERPVGDGTESEEEYFVRLSRHHVFLPWYEAIREYM